MLDIEIFVIFKYGEQRSFFVLDVNECLMNPCVDAKCKNTFGSFICTCDEGYTVDETGLTCVGKLLYQTSYSGGENLRGGKGSAQQRLCFPLFIEIGKVDIKGTARFSLGFTVAVVPSLQSLNT